MPHDKRPPWPVMSHITDEPAEDGDTPMLLRVVHWQSMVRRNQALGVGEDGVTPVPGSGPGGTLTKHEAYMRNMGWTG